MFALLSVQVLDSLEKQVEPKGEAASNIGSLLGTEPIMEIYLHSSLNLGVIKCIHLFLSSSMNLKIPWVFWHLHSEKLEPKHLNLACLK